MSEAEETEETERSDESEEALEIGGRLLAKNTILNIAGQLVPLIGVLVLAPYLIQTLGEVRSGILGVCLALLNFSPVLDLGLGRALRKRVAEALGRGDREAAATITATTPAMPAMAASEAARRRGMVRMLVQLTMKSCSSAFGIAHTLRSPSTICRRIARSAGGTPQAIPSRIARPIPMAKSSAGT